MIETMIMAIVCDRCNLKLRITPPPYTEDEARSAVKPLGWGRALGHDYCGVCWGLK